MGGLRVLEGSSDDDEDDDDKLKSATFAQVLRGAEREGQGREQRAEVLHLCIRRTRPCLQPLCADASRVEREGQDREQRDRAESREQRAENESREQTKTLPCKTGQRAERRANPGNHLIYMILGNENCYKNAWQLPV